MQLIVFPTPRSIQMLNRRHVLGLLAATPLLARPAFAASPQVFAVDGVAIRGTDPVAYFDQMMPVAGKADHALMWNGAQWLFASAENMAKFEANPEAFAPQYWWLLCLCDAEGGYCHVPIQRLGPFMMASFT